MAAIDAGEQIPDQGVLYTFTFNWDPVRVPMIAFGTRAEFDRARLPTWAVVDDDAGRHLEATELRFPAIFVQANESVADITGPIERTRAELEGEYGAMPAPTWEPWRHPVLNA